MFDYILFTHSVSVYESYDMVQKAVNVYVVLYIDLASWIITLCRALASASRVAELNPYVAVAVLTHELNEKTDLSYLSQFQVITLTIVCSAVWYYD